MLTEAEFKFVVTGGFAVQSWKKRVVLLTDDATLRSEMLSVRTRWCRDAHRSTFLSACLGVTGRQSGFPLSNRIDFFTFYSSLDHGFHFIRRGNGEPCDRATNVPGPDTRLCSMLDRTRFSTSIRRRRLYTGRAHLYGHNRKACFSIHDF